MNGSCPPPLSTSFLSLPPSLPHSLTHSLPPAPRSYQSQSGNALLAAVLLSAEARLAEFTLEELRQLGQACPLPPPISPPFLRPVRSVLVYPFFLSISPVLFVWHSLSVRRPLIHHKGLYLRSPCTLHTAS